MDVRINRPEELFSALAEALKYMELECEPKTIQNVLDKGSEQMKWHHTSEYWTKKNFAMLGVCTFLRQVMEDKEKFNKKRKEKNITDVEMGYDTVC